MSAIGRRVSKFSGYALAIPTPFDDAGTVASVKRANDTIRTSQRGRIRRRPEMMLPTVLG